MVLARAWTEAEIMAFGADGEKVEIVDGEPVVTKSGIRQEEIGVNIAAALKMFVRANRLGTVVGSSAGFWMVTGNVRSPDVGFIARRRLSGRTPQGFLNGAPDLAVEVLSPNDNFGSLKDKLNEYFRSGCRLVWVMNPFEETVVVYRSTTPERLLRRGDLVTGDDVIPGFTLSVDEILAEVEPEDSDVPEFSPA